MKKSIIILSAAVALMGLAAACGEVDTPAKGDAGALTLTINSGSATKASDNTVLPAEKAVNTLDVFIFRQDGALYQHLALGDMTAQGEGVWTASLTNVPAAAYTVEVIANGPDGTAALTTKSAVDATVITLSNCDAAAGFVMGGAENATITNGGVTNVTVPISRYCARVRIKDVNNGVPASLGLNLSVKAVYLENVYGTWSLGAGTLSQWVNLAGRESGQNESSTPSHYIVAASQVNPAAYAAQVFFGVSSSDQNIANGDTKTYNKYFYAMPSDKTADHFGPTTVAQATAGILPRLVIVAQAGTQTYYYPVTLFKNSKGLERNTAYDVSVSITGMGSDDPNQPVPTGSLVASVTVSNWDTGATYNEAI